MQRLVWSAALLVVFGVGLATGLRQRQDSSDTPRLASLQARIADLQHQVAVLQEQLGARDEALAALRQQALPPSGSVQAAVTTPAALPLSSQEQKSSHEQPLQAAGATEENARDTETDGSAPPTAEVALAHFYQYLDETEGMGWQERRRQARAMAETLREMGEPAVEALLQTLAEGVDSRERRAAAGFLGSLQDPRVLPALQEVLVHEEDLMLRRAAARSLRRLQLPETIPVLETILVNDQEDRFVRMSAAYGLAQLGESQGFTGLAQIFDESKDDGRGRYVAFRALLGLNDARALPVMRQLVASDTDVTYRLGAIRFLAEHGDRQALPLLDQVLTSPTEQPSILDAAAQAHATISNGK